MTVLGKGPMGATPEPNAWMRWSRLDSVKEWTRVTSANTGPPARAATGGPRPNRPHGVALINSGV